MESEEVHQEGRKCSCPGDVDLAAGKGFKEARKHPVDVDQAEGEGSEEEEKCPHDAHQAVG